MPRAAKVVPSPIQAEAIFVSPLIAEALHVEGDFFLPLRDQHAGVEDAGFQHRAQAKAQALGT
ncbi:MAG: hypothetical protein Q8J75_07725 [Rhodocyclaceae bacterium]|nr:hypothetical protein [Rhodocyclaceae bacterium]